MKWPVKRLFNSSRRCRRLRRAGSGLTLVEVTLALLVLAIAGAMVVPMVRGTQSTQLRSAARLLAADIDYARVQTITHNDDPRILVLDEDGSRYHLALASAPTEPLTDPAMGGEYVTRFGVGRGRRLDAVTIAEHNLDDNELAFGMYGELERTDHATITLAAGDRRLTVTVDSDNGEVTIGELQ